MAHLPHYHPTQKYYQDPVYKDSFEVHYITNDLSEEEKIVLLSNTYKIEKNFIYLNINTNDNNGIPVFKYLTKLNNFCLMVLVQNKIGHIIGKFIYTDCSFPNLEEDMVDFSWQENDDILTPKIEIKYENLEYIDLEDFKRYDRQKKLERLLKDD